MSRKATNIHEIAHSEVEFAPIENEAQFRTFFYGAPVGMALVAPDGRWLRVNRALCELVGYSEAELITTTFQAITHPDDLEIDLEQTARLLQGEVPFLKFEKRYIHRHGHTVWARLDVALVIDADGQPLHFITHVQDITEQKRSQQVLQESQELYRSFVDSVDGIIWEGHAPDFGNTFVSGQTQRLLGYPASAWLSSPRFWEDHLHPEDRARALVECEQGISGGRSYRSEYRMIAADGRQVWFEDVVTVVVEAAQPLKLRGVMVDITARKQAELALLETTRLQRAILDGANYTIISTEPDGTIRHFNAAAERWLGYAASELVGRATPAILHDPQEIVQRARELTQELGRSVEPGFEVFVAKARLGVPDENPWTYIRKDGRRFPVRLSVTALHGSDGAITGFLGIGSDLSESHRAEARLQEALEIARDLRFALDESAIVAITDQTGTIQFVNDQFCQISGYARDELLGQDHRLINSGHHPKAFIQGLWTTIANGRVWRGELRNRAKDGTIYWEDTTIVPFLDPHGKPRQYVAIRYDITERKRAEDALRDFTARLERSNKELEDFAFVASHDLQEPLRKVQAFGDRLKTRHARELGPEGLENLKRMNGAVGRMQILIRDLLAYSRIITKAQPFERVDLDQVVRDVLSDLEVSLTRSGGRVELGELGGLVADQTQMRQLFQNLIGNALKFQREGVPPVVRVSGRRLESTNGRSARLMEIEVEDNGIGFDEKYLDRIFAPFKRLHSRSAFEGTGIGLAICRKIVERHSGEITAQSRPGEGSRFIVTLPLGQPKSDRSLEETAS